MPFRKNPQNGGCLCGQVFRSLSPHFPPLLNHFLQTFFVPFSDQLLDNEELLDRDALETVGNPVELPDRDELLENDLLSLLLENLLLENVLGDCGLPGESLLPEGFPDPLPAGVTPNALPRGLDDLPLPFALGLCRGVLALVDVLLEWAVRPLDVFEKIVRPLEDLDLE